MASIVAFGPLFAFPLFISVTERRDLLSLPVVLRAVNRTERAIVVPVGALVGFTGVYQAIDGPYAFDDDLWMTIGFVLYLLVFGALVLVVEPMRAQAADEAERLLDEAEDEDEELPLSEAYHARMRVPNALMPAIGIVLLFIVYLMEIKPG
jgi:peptidoglycan/LPS O-acetylase OafA/YrhL